jgi:hypothetical protein
VSKSNEVRALILEPSSRQHTTPKLTPTFCRHLSDIISRDKEKHPDFFYVQDVLHVCSAVLKWEFQGTFGYKRCKNDQFVTKNETLLAQAIFWFRKPTSQ